MMRHGIEPFEVGRDLISPVSPDTRARVTRLYGRIEKLRSRRSVGRMSLRPQSRRCAIDRPAGVAKSAPRLELQLHLGLEAHPVVCCGEGVFRPPVGNLASEPPVLGRVPD